MWRESLFHKATLSIKLLWFQRSISYIKLKTNIPVLIPHLILELFGNLIYFRSRCNEHKYNDLLGWISVLEENVKHLLKVPCLLNECGRRRVPTKPCNSFQRETVLSGVVMTAYTAGGATVQGASAQLLLGFAESTRPTLVEKFKDTSWFCKIWEFRKTLKNISPQTFWFDKCYSAFQLFN